jgi:hypothetical protein
MLFGKAELSINLDCHGRVQRFPRNDIGAFGAGITKYRHKIKKPLLYRSTPRRGVSRVATHPADPQSWGYVLPAFFYTKKLRQEVPAGVVSFPYFHPTCGDNF